MLYGLWTWIVNCRVAINLHMQLELSPAVIGVSTVHAQPPSKRGPSPPNPIDSTLYRSRSLHVGRDTPRSKSIPPPLRQKNSVLPLGRLGLKERLIKVRTRQQYRAIRSPHVLTRPRKMPFIISIHRRYSASIQLLAHEPDIPRRE